MLMKRPKADRSKYWTPFKFKTHEEQMAEMFSLGRSKNGGVNLKVKPPKEKPPKKPKKRGPKPGRRKNNIILPQPSDRTDVSSDHVCASIPLQHDVSSLQVFVPANVRKEMKTRGYGMERAAQQRTTSSVRLGKAHKVPWDMFSIVDIVEFTGTRYPNVVNIAASLGYLKRLPGRHWYAPVTRDQAKAIMHHIYLARTGLGRELSKK